MSTFHYDLHIHSALSPCAENNMTPVTIVGAAKLNGLDFVAISDHNAIANVEIAIKAGKEYGIKVVPAFELQTIEEIHVLCLFETYKDLKNFFYEIDFGSLKNKKEIFGDQLIIDEDDNIIGEESRMLLSSANISSDDVPNLISKYNGIAIPAHIDREMNGMLQILGDVTDIYNTVEISSKAAEIFINAWKTKKNIIIDSDAHILDDISNRGEIELEEYTISALLNKLGRK